MQVCEQMEHPETRDREVRALLQGMKELSLMKSFVVTREESTEIQKDDGSMIIILPVWKFCLMAHLCNLVAYRVYIRAYLQKMLQHE